MTIELNLDALRQCLADLVKPHAVDFDTADRRKPKAVVYKFFPTAKPKVAGARLMEIERRCVAFLGKAVRPHGVSSMVNVVQPGSPELTFTTTEVLLLQRGNQRSVLDARYYFELRDNVCVTNVRVPLPDFKLEVELVPHNCWYKSLYRQMPRSRWNKLRAKVCADAGNVCAICAAGGTLYCHEVWKYDDAKHVQTLTGFRVICRMCNFSTHLGLAQNLAMGGHLNMEAVIQHFLTVNGVDRELFEAHKSASFRLWRERSTHEWRTDLREWSSLVLDNVKAGGRRQTAKRRA